MARIAGVNLPNNKRVLIALTYIYGIGRYNSKKICEEAGFSDSLRTSDLTEEDVAKIRSIIESKYAVEGDLRRNVSMSIKRLMDLGTYRGFRHRRGLPARGQNTRTNCRTRKGPKKTVANKKK